MVRYGKKIKKEAFVSIEVAKINICILTTLTASFLLRKAAVFSENLTMCCLIRPTMLLLSCC